MNIRKKRVIKAMTDDEFYTRDVPSVPAGKVVVKPHRGDWTVFIGLPDGTVAYQWCESKVKAQREAEYAKNHIKKNGNQDDFWIGQGYKIWNPNVESKKKVACKAAPKRKTVIKAAAESQRFVAKQRTALDGKTWWCVFDTKENRWSTKMNHGKYKTKKECEYAISNGIESAKSVKCSTDDSEFLDVTFTAREGYEPENLQILREMRDVALSLGDSTSGDYKNGTLIVHTDIYHYEDMKKALDYLLHEYDQPNAVIVSKAPVTSSTSTKRKFTVKASSNRNDFIRKLNKVYQAYMAIETDADLRKSGMTHAEWEALPEVFKKLQADGWAQTIMSGLAEFFKRNGFSIHMDKNNVNYIIVAADEYVPASTSIKRKFTVKASEELSGTYYIVYNGDIIEETDGTGDAGEEALGEIFSMHEDALAAAIEYLNSFGDPIVDDDEVDDASRVARILAQFISMEYDEAEFDPSYFGSEISWDGGRIEWFDSSDLAESNNVDEWIENTDLSAEDIGIDSAQSVKCASGAYGDFDETMRFRVVSYFDNNFRDISDDATFDDLREAEAQAHEWLAHGPVSIEDYYVGRIDIDPDEYWDAFENAAEFACTPAIAEWQDEVWKSMGIGASQSVKCSESIMAFQDSLTDELYRVAEQEILQTSKLASYDPYVSIDEDSFECTFTGTAWGTYLQYGIRFDAHSDKFDFKNYFDWDKIEREQLSWLDPDSDTCLATIRFFIAVDGSKVHADVEDVVVTRDGTYSELNTEQYKNIIDFDKFGAAIVQLADPVIQDIHYTLSQAEPDLYDEDIESSTSITSARRDDTIDKEAVRELILYITNDGDLYRQRVTPMIENLKKKVKKGVYDREKAVKLWQYLADDGVKKYGKEFGPGASVAWLNPATREEIARQLRDYYEEEVMWDVNHPESSDDLTTV